MESTLGGMFLFFCFLIYAIQSESNKKTEKINRLRRERNNWRKRYNDLWEEHYLLKEKNEKENKE